MLGTKDWAGLEACNGVDEMVEIFKDNITSALDEIVPIKNFTVAVRSKHKFGLSNETKDLMQKRDQCRAEMKNASISERSVLHTKYKLLRNKATAKIRKDNVKTSLERRTLNHEVDSNIFFKKYFFFERVFQNI